MSNGVHLSLLNVDAVIKGLEKRIDYLVEKNAKLERVIEKSWTPEQIAVALDRYEKKPVYFSTSDDSYSTYEYIAPWEQLSIDTKIRYVYGEDESNELS